MRLVPTYLNDYNYTLFMAVQHFMNCVQRPYLISPFSATLVSCLGVTLVYHRQT